MLQRLAMCILFLLLNVISLSAGEEPFVDVRYPRYEKGRLASEIIAEKADTTAVGPKNTRVIMSGVTIKIYDTSEKALGATPADKPLPLKLIITSKKGSYNRRQLPGRKDTEDIAYLQKDVKVCRYRVSETGRASDKKIVETTISCDNATWNNSTRVMEGSGLVTFNSWSHPEGAAPGREPDRVLTGDDFTYEADDKIEGKPGKPENMGGRFFLKKNVTMTIYDRTRPGKPGKKESEKTRTVITCKGLASFYLTARDLQFEDTVKVDQVGMVITSEFLRVWMLKGSAQPVKEIKAWKNVVIVSKPDADGKACIAKGGSARYQCIKEELVLVDPRKGINPEARLGTDVISNEVLEFHIRDGSIYQLKAIGEKGMAEMKTASPGSSGEIAKTPVKTTITFNQYMIFQHSKNRAVFVGDVVLKRERLTLSADKLTAELAPEKKGGGGHGKALSVWLPRAMLSSCGMVAELLRQELRWIR